MRSICTLASTLTVAALAAASAIPQARAVPTTVPIRLSYPTFERLQKNPAEYKLLLSRLPHRPAGRAITGPRFVGGPTSGVWEAVTAAPNNNIGWGNPVQLFDGTLMVQDAGSTDWWRLTPDSTGNYANGTWSELALLPVINGTQYSPLYHSTGVLPDGRVIVMGGEYNNFVPVWTNLGAIYNPATNTWTPVAAPKGPGWSTVGDAESIVLASGTYLQASCCAYPDQDALFRPLSLGWTPTRGPSGEGQPYQDEQGYTLLPNGNVLTVDIWTYYPTITQPTGAEQYLPGQGIWVSAGNTPVSLVDPPQCGNYEIGPSILRGNGTVFYFGGNTGCVAGAATDPTAIYNTATGQWSPGPTVPSICGTNGTTPCSLPDAPAALEPNGNILFAASSGYGDNPTHFFEVTPTNTINQVADELYYASYSGAYYYNFIVLPSGQIFATDFSGTAEIYTPASGPISAWAPVVTSAPTSLTPGSTYTIKGKQLNGVSQGAGYGDDVQMATNYPIVRIVNTASGNVSYAVTKSVNSFSVAPNASSYFSFTVPAGVQAGASSLYVVANGIASAPVSVTVQ